MIRAALCLGLSLWAWQVKADESSQRMQYLQKQLKAQEAKIENLQQQNMILNEVGPKNSSAQAMDVPTLKTNAAGKIVPQGERKLYSSLLEAFQRGLLVKVEHLQSTLMKTYPNSVYNDNALYFAGLLQFEKGLYAQALKSFNTLLEHYPMGNKRPAALYAKAATYKRLNLPKFADGLLENIMKMYPGSPEARRAQTELRIHRNT